MKRGKIFFLCFLAAGLCEPALAAPGYRVLERIVLAGEGGWGQVCLEPESGKLFLARGSHVMVLDVNDRSLSGELMLDPGVRGIAILPGFRLGLVSNGQTDHVTVFHLDTLQRIRDIAVGADPDAMVYEHATRHAFIFNGCGRSVTVLTVPDFEVAAAIDLGGHPEDAVADGQGRLYVNLKDQHQIAEIDARRLAVTRRFGLGPGEKPVGLAMDPARRRLFAVCRNRTLAIVDAESGGLLGTVTVGAGAAGVAYDPRSGLVFTSNGWDGTLSVVRENRGQYEVAETVPTQTGGRTLALDSRTGMLFLPAAELDPLPGETGGGPRKLRPKLVKDTFQVLMVGREEP